MTVNHLVTGSNPVSGAIFLDPSKTPINTTLNQVLASEYSNCDTIEKNNDTIPLRLYKVSKIFYYRRRIKQKLFRISLKTKNIKTALKRRKILDLIDGEEMYKIKTKDFKLMFEYDTEEELRAILEHTKEIQIQAQLQRYREVKQHVENVEAIHFNDINFELLQDKYIARKIADGRASADSIGAYTTTFKKLIEFYKNDPINSMSVEDFEAFKDHLVKIGGIKNKTINKHLKYMKRFVKWAKVRKLISENNAEPVTLLDEIKENQERKATVENYSDQEVRDILSYKYDNEVYNKILSIAVYTGMRISEVHNLEQDNIKQEGDIHYFDITKSKTVAGIRKVPIHKNILDMVLNTSFPLMPISKNAFEKKVRDRLYKVIKQGEGKTVHTLRGTFTAKAYHKNIIGNENITPIIQDIIGHTKNAKEALTGGTYAKGIAPITIQQEIVNSVEF